MSLHAGRARLLLLYRTIASHRHLAFRSLRAHNTASFVHAHLLLKIKMFSLYTAHDKVWLILCFKPQGAGIPAGMR